MSSMSTADFGGHGAYGIPYGDESNPGPYPVIARG